MKQSTEQISDWPRNIRTVPMSAQCEPEACGDTVGFFLRDIPFRQIRGQFRFRKIGPRSVEWGDLMLFHHGGEVVADARLLEICRYPIERVTDVYRGHLRLDCSRIRVFSRPVPHAEFKRVWVGVSLSNVWHDLDRSRYPAWERLVSTRGVLVVP